LHAIHIPMEEKKEKEISLTIAQKLGKTGLISIPKEVRDLLGIEQGDIVILELKKIVKTKKE